MVAMGGGYLTHKGTSEDGIWLYGKPGHGGKAGNITGWVVDTWYHIAVVRNGASFYMFIKAKLQIYLILLEMV